MPDDDLGDSGRDGDADLLEWAIAGRPAEGQAASGDLAAVQVTDDRWVLAVVDGLGHGPAAADAANRAIRAIEGAQEEPLTSLLVSVHRSLVESRGAAATVAVIERDSGVMSWLGVGNVEGIVVRRGERARPRNHGVFLHGGVLGKELPPLKQPEGLQLVDGDRIAIATDGVRADLAEELERELTVDRLAHQILTDATPSDDAVVLVACYRSTAGAARSHEA